MSRALARVSAPELPAAVAVFGSDYHWRPPREELGRPVELEPPAGSAGPVAPWLELLKAGSHPETSVEIETEASLADPRQEVPAVVRR